MANARPHRKTLDVSEGVSRPDAQGRRAVCARRVPQRSRVLWNNYSCASRLRGLSRAVWPERPARSNRRPGRAPPGLLFLWAYAALALLPPKLETMVLLVAPVIAIGFLIALPLVSGTGEKSWRRRPVAVLIVLLMIVSLAAFTQLGTYAPWSPKMDAWSSAPIPPKLLDGRSALERQGAVVFQAKQCRNCHALGGEGGQRGPALDTVATRLTADQLIR